MKKYISFQLSILLCLCAPLYLKSMEIEQTQDTTCYLALLPVELLNYIEQLLLFSESHEEFIARTNKEKDEKFPEEHYAYFSDDINLKKGSIYGVFSPDKHKVALCDLLFHICYQPDCTTCKSSRLIILDLEQPEEEKVVYVGHFDKDCHRAIGLSSSGMMFAVIKKEDKKEEACIGFHKKHHDVLMVNKIIEKSNIYKTSENSMDSRLMKVVKQKCIADIPDGFIVSHLMFNKQGTHIIAYGQDNRPEELKETHLTFGLKEYAEERVAVENKDGKNFLLDYFRHYRVCNKEIKGVEK